MKLDRLIGIVALLSEGKRINAPELSKIFEVSVRTIFRDLECLSQAGIPIVSSPGLYGGISIMKGYRLERHLFDEGELKTLLQSLAVRSFLDDNITSIVLKLKGLVPNERLDELSENIGRLVIDTTSWGGSQGELDRVKQFNNAIERHSVMSFYYIDKNCRKKQRMVEPYRLLFKQNHWYLEAFCLDRQADRTFRLSRMSDITALSKTFVPRPLGLAALSDIQTKPLVNVKLHIEPEGIVQLIDSVQDITPIVQTDGSWLVELPLSDDMWSYCFLLGFGTRCRCLGPETYLSHFMDYLNEMVKKYVAQ